MLTDHLDTQLVQTLESDDGEIDLEFYFSSYNEVYSVSIYDAECEIDSAYSY